MSYDLVMSLSSATDADRSGFRLVGLAWIQLYG